MSILAKWDVGTHNATGVVGVTDAESQWSAFMAYLTTNGILFVPSPDVQTPADPGLYCYKQLDKSYTIFQAVATPDWNVNEWGPPQIYVTEVAYLSWILVPK